jgi:hypothetical protein
MQLFLVQGLCVVGLTTLQVLPVSGTSFAATVEASCSSLSILKMMKRIIMERSDLVTPISSDLLLECNVRHVALSQLSYNFQIKLRDVAISQMFLELSNQIPPRGN